MIRNEEIEKGIRVIRNTQYCKKLRLTCFGRSVMVYRPYCYSGGTGWLQIKAYISTDLSELSNLRTRRLTDAISILSERLYKLRRELAPLQARHPPVSPFRPTSASAIMFIFIVPNGQILTILSSSRTLDQT